jgi:hypothetical protein
MTPSPDLLTSLLATNPEIRPRTIHPINDMAASSLFLTPRSGCRAGAPVQHHLRGRAGESIGAAPHCASERSDTRQPAFRLPGG